MTKSVLARAKSRLLVLLFQKPRVWKYRLLSDCRDVVGRPLRVQPAQLKGRGEIVFAGRVCLGYYPSPHFFSSYIYIEARHPTARITIGDGTFINNGCGLVSEHAGIHIGKRVLVGPGVEIMDSDFHGLAADQRHRSPPEASATVNIGDNVFLGSNVRVLKGVTNGENSVIANSAVVASDIPANVIAAGNPARVIRNL